MKKKITAMLLAICCISSTWSVQAADFSSGSADVEMEIAEEDQEDEDFSDGEDDSVSGGDISAMANQIVAHAEVRAQEYQELKKEAKKYADAQEVARRAQEMKEETTRIREKALKEAAKRKEEKRVAKRQEVADFAVQFVGNPYVWGGTSLTSGADCSGFVQSVYANFGVSLPRTSYEQQNWGTEVSYADAQPGDLICYGGHVAIYMGNGQIVHASNSRDGIKISNNAAYRTILSVRRPS